MQVKVRLHDPNFPSRVVQAEIDMRALLQALNQAQAIQHGEAPAGIGDGDPDLTIECGSVRIYFTDVYAEAETRIGGEVKATPGVQG